MSYAAEPYAQFVDDLLTALTGGVIRKQFRFAADEAPFGLAPPGALVPSTLRVFGQADARFRQFQRDRDYRLGDDAVVEWLARPDGTPAPDAVWPDEGTPFYANYDYLAPSGPVPTLSDRNPGSVTRLLAESFAREMAVLSKQLEAVYQAGFLDTATGRDLDQVVALVGVERHLRTSAIGTVVFSRATPALADVFIRAGTRLSTAEPPAVTFATAEDRTLERGSLSVEVPIRAEEPGPQGVVPAGRITVVHRPIFGVESAANPQTTQLGGPDETDEALRGRARRALEGAGKATEGAIISALATLPGVREKDVRIESDHLTRPGVLTLNVAADLDDAARVRAVQLIEETRPAGVRVLHNLDTATPLAALEPGENAAEDDDQAASATIDPGALFFPVVATAVLLPASALLSAGDRGTLQRRGEAAIRAVVADAGIGETLVYNRMVAALMAIDGVLDVTAELYPAVGPAPATRVRRNVDPGAHLRPSVAVADGGAVRVEVGGQLVALDVTVQVRLKGAALVGTGPDGVATPDELAVNLEDARLQIAGQLGDAVPDMPSLSAERLLAATVSTETFDVAAVSFTLEFVQAGLRINRVFAAGDPEVAVDPLQRPWVRRVLLEAVAA